MHVQFTTKMTSALFKHKKIACLGLILNDVMLKFTSFHLSIFIEEEKIPINNKESILFYRRMGKRKVLSTYERCKIVEMRAAGSEICNLAKEFEVSERTIFRVLRKREAKKKPHHRPRVLTPHGRRKILAESRQNPTKSAKAIANSLGLSISDRTVQQVLRENTFVHVQRRKPDCISKMAMDKRITFTRTHLPKGMTYWLNVVFSDEKKWNLKGNDGYISIWVEKDRKYTFDTDVQRHPGMMTWGAICANGGALHLPYEGRNYQPSLC